MEVAENNYIKLMEMLDTLVRVWAVYGNILTEDAGKGRMGGR